MKLMSQILDDELVNIPLLLSDSGEEKSRITMEGEWIPAVQSLS